MICKGRYSNYYCYSSAATRHTCWTTVTHCCCVQVEVVDGTYNFSEPLVDWTWYMVVEDRDRPLTHHRLDDLEPRSFYELQVIAVNELGRSDVSDQFIFSTAADDQGSSPSDVLCLSCAVNLTL